MRRLSAARRAAFAFAVFVCCAHPASAQTPVGVDTGFMRCLDTVSADPRSRGPVYLHPVALDTSTAAISAAALFTEDIAAALRPLLGDSGSAVPEGEPRLTWRDVTGFVRVVLFRNGQHRLVRVDSANNAMRLVARAAERLTPDAEADLLPAPGPDSVTIVLTFIPAPVDADGHLTPVSERPLIPAFTMAFPRVERVALVEEVRPAYPSHWNEGRAEATVTVSFVIDTAGRADLSTFHDAWPRDRPRPTGEAAAWYRDFLDAIRKSVGSSRYRPARVGGCPIPQLVQQPFAFRLNR